MFLNFCVACILEISMVGLCCGLFINNGVAELLDESDDIVDITSKLHLQFDGFEEMTAEIISLY